MAWTQETKFTPGPWRAEPDDQVPHRGSVYIEGPRGWGLQPVAACDYLDDIEEAEANAALIAAAPNLYAAGEALIRLHDTYTGEARDDDAISLAMDELRAALRRARGEG